MEDIVSVFSGITDEELCLMNRRDAEEELVLRHTKLVRACARPYFLAGGDGEDLIQEGMLGLIKAVREYDAGRQASFKTYAELCIKHRLYSAIRSATGGKHSPLNESVSLETPSFSEHVPLSRFSDAQQHQNPEELIIGREAFEELSGRLKGQLSEFEAKVLGLYLEGLSYREIGAKINKSLKSVDNAVQRIRRKVELLRR